MKGKKKEKLFMTIFLSYYLWQIIQTVTINLKWIIKNKKIEKTTKQ